ncbi:MAG: adenylyl-sulfate kinase [bacterium]
MKKNENNNNKIKKIKKPATTEDLELYSYVTERAKRISEEVAEFVKNSQYDKGGIIFVYGVQNSGKTIVACEVLDNLSNSQRKVIAIQPDVKRSDVLKGVYYSRSGVERKVKSFSTKTDIAKIFNEADVVLVDEVHFIPYELQVNFLKETMAFIERGGWLIAIGVLATSQGGEFLLSAVLKDRATKLYELTATCQKCGRKGARYNQRLINGLPTVSEDPELLAPSDIVVYEPRCEDCRVNVG